MGRWPLGQENNFTFWRIGADHHLNYGYRLIGITRSRCWEAGVDIPNIHCILFSLLFHSSSFDSAVLPLPLIYTLSTSFPFYLFFASYFALPGQSLRGMCSAIGWAFLV